MTTTACAKPADRPLIAKLRCRSISKIVGMTSITPHHDLADRARSVFDIVDRLGHEPVTALGVWAHPDDESLLAGGLLAAIADRGGEVVNVAATAGEHGTDDPTIEPPAVLAARRRRELDDALAALGADSAIHLGYADGSCAEVTEALAAHLVGRIIDRVQPDVIVTFGPDGVTGHPDHQTVHRWVRRAVADRGDRIPLVGTTAAGSWPADAIDALHTIDAFWPGYPCAGPTEDDVIVRLDAHLLERKLDALACHASQMGPVVTALGPDRFADLAAVESYVALNHVAHRALSPEAMPIAA